MDSLAAAMFWKPRWLGLALGNLALLGALFPSLGRQLLFYPTHNPPGPGLHPWREGAHYIGQCLQPADAPVIWLLLHGNAGQASDRSYALGKIPRGDAVYVLEYPGYGERPGSPSMASLNQAAKEAYELLRQRHPHRRIAVIGESLGSGPACYLCSLPAPPDRLVLMTPFDRLAAVAADHFPAFLVTLLLGDDWDNIGALRGYAGPIAIFAGTVDTVIPPAHARALAASRPQAILTMFSGGHNDWAASAAVRIED